MATARNAGDDVVLGSAAMQPMGEPGRYSLMSAIANASASTLSHCATLARNGNKNEGRDLPSCGRTIGQRMRHVDVRRRRASEVREGDLRNGVEQVSLFGLRDEVIAVVQSWR
jgi:hypothetical protein